MIQVGTRVQWSDSKLTGTVSAIHAQEFDVIWDNSEGHTSKGLLYSFLVQRFEGRPYVQVIPSEPITEAAVSKYRDATIQRLAHNIGRMEYTIEILFDHITRMRGTADMYGHLEVVADCDSLRDTITRCALALQDMPSVDGGSKPTELKTYIAARQ